MPREWLKVVLPILVLLLSALVAWIMIATPPRVVKRPREIQPPEVRVVSVSPRDVQLVVRTQGTVRARTESVLLAEVSGRVVYVSPSLRAGGFFAAGEELLRIDPRDYRDGVVRAESQVVRAGAEVVRADSRVAQAESQVAGANLRLETQRAEAEIARHEWERLGSGKADPLVLREPQVAEARAAVKSAEAALQSARAERDAAKADERAAEALLREARRNLARTSLLAPYPGRVRVKNADLGQFVNRGTPVATVYAVDYAEVRLPLPDEQLAYLDLSLGYRPRGGLPPPPPLSETGGRGHAVPPTLQELGLTSSEPRNADSSLADGVWPRTVEVERPALVGESSRAAPGGPHVKVTVTLRANFAGQEHAWSGVIVRTEGEIDPRTRMVYLVAQVKDPYGRIAAFQESSRENQDGMDIKRPPLAVGMFVRAEIHGKKLEQVIVLPRSALRGRSRVLVVERESIRVQVLCPGLEQDEVEQAICARIEVALQDLGGVADLQTEPAPGLGAVTVTLQDDAEPKTLLKQVADRMKSIADLPEQVEKITISTWNRLRFRELETLPNVDVFEQDGEINQSGEDVVVVRRGLQPGDLVCLSPLEVVVEDMLVRIRGEEVVHEPKKEQQVEAGP